MASNELPSELGFTPGRHAVRVERRPWVYWVRGVKSFESLRRDWFAGSGLLEQIVLSGVEIAFESWWRRHQRWKVGIIRLKGSRWGPQSPTKLLYKETLPAGVEPIARIAELVERVRSGEFED